MRSNIRQFHDTVAAWALARKPRASKVGDAGNDAGLTLVEMIVVLVIIAIVGTMVTMSVINRPDQAKVTTTKADMATIGGALKMYRLDNGDYPTTAQGLKALAEKPTTPPLPSNWNAEGYVAQAPVDAWGNPYIYASPAPGGFLLKSYGKDGKEGGEGIDADIVPGK
ncbi:MAG: type II secretion system major pseudopilin GspG [Pseudomonadota bacterium]